MHPVSRKTATQAADAQQAYAQREGYVIAYVATTQRIAGCVSGGDMERAKAEAKARFPIRGLRRRVLEVDVRQFRVSRDGNSIEFRYAGVADEVEQPWSARAAVLTREEVERACELFKTPDEPYVTDE